MISDKELMTRSARRARLYHDEYDASIERSLKTNAIVAANRKLYQDGYDKGLKAVPLENFSDLVEQNGKMVQRKDHRSFKAGYLRGYEELIIRQNSVNNNKTR